MWSYVRRGVLRPDADGDKITVNGKTQWIRLADVFFIGPLMTYVGARYSRKQPVAGWTLALLGVGTVLYNGMNYLQLREAS